MAIDLHILNSGGVLNVNLENIHSAFEIASKKSKKLQISNADVVVRSNKFYAIEELGVGGFSDSLNQTIYISINIDKKPSAILIESSIDHELYHIKRYELLGLPNTLKERAIDEGLACLYEYEATGCTPVYADQKLEEKVIEKMTQHFNDTEDTDKWFFGGEGIPKWTAYSFGYKLAKAYSIKHEITSKDLLKIKADKILKAKA